MEKTKAKSSTAGDKTSKTQPGQEAIVNINFRVPSKMPSVYATHCFVQETPDEVVISFFELSHPIILPEQEASALEILKERGVVAECISRVVVAKHKFPQFAQAFTETSERIVEGFKQLEKNANNKSNNKKS